MGVERNILFTVMAIFLYHSFTDGFVLSLFFQKLLDITSFSAMLTSKSSYLTVSLFWGRKLQQFITNMRRQDGGRTEAQDGGIPLFFPGGR